MYYNIKPCLDLCVFFGCHLNTAAAKIINKHVHCLKSEATRYGPHFMFEQVDLQIFWQQAQLNERLDNN